MIVLANAYKPILLDKERAFLNTLQLRLFVNNHVITGGSGLASFTQPSDSGYAPLTGVNFAVPTLVGSQGVTVAPPVTWTFTLSAGSFPIWGYTFHDPAAGYAFVFGENAPAVITISGAGQQYTVTPRKLMDTY